MSGLIDGPGHHTEPGYEVLTDGVTRACSSVAVKSPSRMSSTSGRFPYGNEFASRRFRRLMFFGATHVSFALPSPCNNPIKQKQRGESTHHHYPNMGNIEHVTSVRAVIMDRCRRDGES